MTKKPLRHVVCIVTMLVCASPASAQLSREGRPYRGLFASSQGSFVQSLTANGSVGVGYDTSVLAEASEAGIGNPVGIPPPSSGGYGALSGGLSYSLSKGRLSAGASTSFVARYFPTLPDRFSTSYGSFAGGISYGRPLSRRTSFSIGQAVSYLPYSVFAPFPTLGEAPSFDEVQIPSQDLSTVRTASLTFDGGIGVSHQFTRKDTVNFGYSYGRINYLDDIGFDTMTHGANIGYARGLNKYLGFRLGYGYSVRQTESQPTTTGHSFDLGLNVGREFAFNPSRRTRITFGTGASATNYNGKTHFGGTGNANLTHEIGRSWAATSSYTRNVGFVDTFGVPIFYDGFGAGLSGLITRRLSFNASWGLAIGEVGFLTGPENGFDSMTAGVSLGTALNRHLSLSAGYTYYQYAFQSTTLLAPNVLPELERHSVGVYLNAWTPIFQRGRRANATR